MAFTSSQLKALRAVSPDGRIAEAIRLSKKSQSAIARETGFSQQWICDLKAGRIRSASLDNARRLAAFFGCPIEDLFPAREAA